MKTRTKIINYLLLLCLVVGMVFAPTGTAFAEDSNIVGGILDLTTADNLSSTEYKYEWNKATKTLTLHNGAVIEGAVLLPDDAQIKVEGGTATVKGGISMAETPVIAGKGASKSVLLVEGTIYNDGGKHLNLTIKDIKVDLSAINNANVNLSDTLTFENAVASIRRLDLPTTGGLIVKNSKLTLANNVYGSFFVNKIVMDKPSSIYSEYPITNYVNTTYPCDFSGIEDFLEEGCSVGEYTHPLYGDKSVTILTENNEPAAPFTLAYPCKLNFDAQGGDMPGGIAFVKGHYEDTINLNLPDYQPTLDNYNFDGWYADAALTKKVTSFKLQNDEEWVYARWTNQNPAPANNNGQGPTATGIIKPASGSNQTGSTKSPDTGDDNTLSLWIALLLVSLSAIGGRGVKLKSRDTNR